MLKKAAILFSVCFILMGILGFVSLVSPAAADGTPLLFGVFAADTSNNILLLTAGVLALAVAASQTYAKLYFQVFGVLFGLLAILGFFGGPVLGVMAVNLVNTLFYLLFAIFALVLGFGFKTQDDISKA